jgi:hypothetical protein
MRRNEPYCVEYQNLRNTIYGARQFKTISDPFAGGASGTHPFPQLFVGNSVNVVGQSAGIKTATVTSTTWTLGSNNAATAGGIWHFMDFYTSWMAFNGASTVMKSLWDASIQVQSTVTINTGAAYNESQPFWGGFNPSNFFSLADWPTFLATYNANIPTEIAALNINGAADMNWVWWGTVGGGDLKWLFSLPIMKFASGEAVPDMGYGADYMTSSELTDYDNYYIFDLMKRNEFGMRPMPWQGKVTGMKQLGKYMMVYGALANAYAGGGVQQPGGIAAMFPQENFWGLDYVKGLPLGVGIAGRGAFAGDNETHLIWDELDNLWLIDANLGAKRLDYSEFISTLSGEPLITYDPHEKEFYITDGTNTFMLSENGLCKAPWHPTTLAIAQGGLVGIAYAEAETPTAVSIVTDKITSESGEQSVLEWIQISGLNKNDSTNWQVYVDWRTDIKETWTRTSAYTPDDRGKIWLGLPFLECRLVFTSTNKANVRLDDVTLSIVNDFKHQNLRFLIDASTPGAATE